MRKLVLAGLAAGLSGLAIPAAQADEAGSMALATGTMAQASATQVVRTPAPGMQSLGMGQHRGAWGSRVNGRWSAGNNAPGGWNSYYRPVKGWSLPSYWINPSFYISDWQSYGLPAPAAGYGWSRYYDDAVLTDRYGRVVDARYGYDWDRYGGYDDAAYGAPPAPLGYDGYAEDRRERTRNTVAGAVVGGVIGGVAGNAIAAHGQKTAGTLVGAGVGALAGGAIGSATSKPRHSKKMRAPDYYDGAPGGYAYAGPNGAPPADYDGRWQGTWYGQDGRAYHGTYDGRFQGEVRGAYAPPPPMAYAPVPAPAYGYGYGYSAGSYASSSYGVDYVAPTVVETTVTTEETSYAVRKAAARRVVHRARPRVRVSCCSCGCN